MNSVKETETGGSKRVQQRYSKELGKLGWVHKAWSKSLQFYIYCLHMLPSFNLTEKQYLNYRSASSSSSS